MKTDAGGPGDELVPDPPSPFEPGVTTLSAGAVMYRVYSNIRGATDFNPRGASGSHRFSFFGDPNVPVLYAAQTEQAAVAETLLHDVPASGGFIDTGDYGDKVMSRLRTTRDLRLATFMGTGLRQLKVTARQLTDTDSAHYPRTTRWASAAHQSGLDGVVWVSRHCNTDRAYVLFGDRVHTEDLAQDDDFARLFAAGDDFDWLVDFCSPLHVEVLTSP